MEEYSTWRVVENTGALLVTAIGRARSSQLSLWDALIVEAAAASGCDVLYSEDLTHGQSFGGLRVENPLR